MFSIFISFCAYVLFIIVLILRPIYLFSVSQKTDGLCEGYGFRVSINHYYCYCRGAVWGTEGSRLEAWMKSHKSEVAII